MLSLVCHCMEKRTVITGATITNIKTPLNIHLKCNRVLSFHIYVIVYVCAHENALQSIANLFEKKKWIVKFCN